MELLLHQWGDLPELYRNTDKTEATEIVIIDSQMNYRGKLDTYSLQLPNDARLKKVYNNFMLSCMKLRKTDHIGGSEGIRLFIHGIIMILRRQLAVSVSGRPCYV